MKTTLQKSIDSGINLRNTCFAGMSAPELRKANPKLAGQWARFVKANKAQLVREITAKLCAS